MPEFEYTARTDTGEEHRGRLEAADAETARSELTARGLEVVTLSEAIPPPTVPAETAGDQPPPSQPGPGESGGGIWLADREAHGVAEGLADVTRAELPLNAGLRALAEEVPGRRLREALLLLARRVESGMSLEEAVAAAGPGIPAHLGGLIAAGNRSGQLGAVLGEYVTQSQRAIDNRRFTVIALAYPLILITALLAVMGFFFLWVVPEFRVIFTDFGTELPGATAAVMSLSDFILAWGIWLVAAGLLVIAGLVAAAFFGTGDLPRRIARRLPLVGPLFRYISLARFCHLLAIFVRSNVALPQALQWAGQGSRDSALARSARSLAEDVEQGIPIEAGLHDAAAFPPELANAFRWADRQQAFVDVLENAGTVYDSRVRIQANMISTITEPLSIVVTAFLIGGLFIVLFGPLIKLLNDLS